MRTVKNYDAQLIAINKRKAALTAKKIQQLGQLVIATGAGNLEPEMIAGIMLAAVASSDAARKEAWSKRGATFFLEKRRKTQRGIAVDGSGAQPDNSSDEPAGE